MGLSGKVVLITGAAQRIGRALALGVARAGADVIIHYNHSHAEAEATRTEIQTLGQKAFLLKADLGDAHQVSGLMEKAWENGPIFALVNNASIFEPLNWESTSLDAWDRHLMINLTAPFLLSQAFIRKLGPSENGRIVNLLDWRALRPGLSHLPYTISKAALAALTQSLAYTLAPRVTVNGLALGAILPPSQGAAPENILAHVPARRWGDPDEVGQALIFLLEGPEYVTGEIIHVDGGRHLA
jgi:NAD(P)-dependent dehydrogenase (short-subunit alcohol dehydrogenase family)